MRKITALFCTIALLGGQAALWAEQPVELTADQRNTLVAPIALYPDELVSQILVASTYPLEVVQAYQWTQQHPELKGQDLTAAAQKEDWDPSVQALVAFPDLLKRLNQDVAWLTNLGNAFLADQAKMMDAIQEMRVRAENAGKLNTTEQQKVTDSTENGQKVVVIEPASPEVVYVPDYDPLWIWGPAPVWYPYAGWYYPPPPPIGIWCWWGPRIVVGSVFIGWNGWGGWGWHPHWGGRTVVVNDVFFRSNHFNTIHVNRVGGREVWVHEPGHRLGVAYPNRPLAQRYRPAIGRPAVHITVDQARQQFRASSARVTGMHAGDRMGNRQIGRFNGNRSAFGGVGSGARANANSARGHSSLGHTSAGVHAPSGGAGGGHEGGGHEGGGHGGGGMGGGHR